MSDQKLEVTDSLGDLDLRLTGLHKLFFSLAGVGAGGQKLPPVSVVTGQTLVHDPLLLPLLLPLPFELVSETPDLRTCVLFFVLLHTGTGLACYILAFTKAWSNLLPLFCLLFASQFLYERFLLIFSEFLEP